MFGPEPDQFHDEWSAVLHGRPAHSLKDVFCVGKVGASH